MCEKKSFFLRQKITLRQTWQSEKSHIKLACH